MTEESEKPGCACDAAPKRIFPCSGAADVGQASDLAARTLAAEGVAKMFCLAGIGGRVGGIMETTKAATAILAIDGCPLDCARKTLQDGGFTRFAHLRPGDLGMAKGKSPPGDAVIEKVADHARRGLST